MTDKKEDKPKFNLCKKSDMELRLVIDNPEEVIELHQRWNQRTRKWENLNCPPGAHVVRKDK